MKKLILLSLALVFVFSALNADYLVKQETKIPSIMGQPEKTMMQEMWIGDGVYASITKGTITIVNSKKNVMYMVYQGSKTYVEMKLPLDISKYLPEQMKPIIQATLNSMSATVTPTGKTVMVGKWKTQLYNVVMNMKTMGMGMKMNMEIYATEDVPFDWEKVSTEYLSNLKASTGQISSKVLNAMKKIKGYAVQTIATINMMGMKIKTIIKVLEITEKTAPAGIYSVPAGYKKVEKMVMKRGRM